MTANAWRLNSEKNGTFLLYILKFLCTHAQAYLLKILYKSIWGL